MPAPRKSAPRSECQEHSEDHQAMQMVATSKMRPRAGAHELARPYAQKMRNVIGHLTEANPDYRHPSPVTRRAKTVA